MSFQSSEYLLKQSDSNISPMVKGEFLRNLDEYKDKYLKFYRNIPVTKTLGGLKSHGVYCENVSGATEIKNSDETLRSKPYYTINNSILGSKLTGNPRKSLKLDDATAVNYFRRKLYSDLSFPSRIRKHSASEPDLKTSVKVPGDSLDFRDSYREDAFLTSKLYGNEKSVPLTETEVGGSIYIKNAGKVYKSKIVAKQFCMEENVFGSTNKQKSPKIPQVGNFVSNSRLSDFSASFGASNPKFVHQEGGDFEIAIFLSGLGNISRRKPQVQDRQLLKTMPLEGGNRKAKKKKSNVRKSGKMNAYDTNRSSRSYRKLSKSNARSELSNRGSESAYDSAKNSDSGDPGRRQVKGTEASGKSCTSPSRNVLAPKMNKGELWTRFESAFKSYASTHRHSGGVMPKKISTEWMANVGVVPEILTEKEANVAFRNAAGARTTMNTNEYKEFLIMLSLQLKLPCYEIYHRMCGMYKEDKTS